ncbi:MAG: response regulator [Phaeodactylibacter sp.]|nr:response regulator [Phaeodactylibacter sp.]
MRSALQKILFSNEHRLERRILAILLLGLAITFGIQFLSQNSINDLLASDEKVMYNYELDNYLGGLDHNLIALESNVRSYVIYEAAGLIADIGTNVAAARNDLAQIKKMAIPGERGQRSITYLDSLVEAKIRFSESVLDSFATGGEEAAFGLLSTQTGLNLRDSIIQITSRMRQQEKQAIAQTIQANREEALRVSTVDYISALLAAAIVIMAIFFFLKVIEKRAAIQEKLEEARRNAEQSALVKEQFMANMSHEIRTPLNAILAYANMLRRSELDGRQQECAEGIQQAGENLLAIVNDILDFSKLEAGMIRLERIPFSVRSLLNSLESMFRPKAGGKSISLAIYPPRSGPDILLGDPTRLTQILSNLLSNAVKFTDEGGVQAWSSLKPAGEERVLLEFTVQDTGIGIPEDKIGQVFERFGQGASDITRRYGGTGLGLAIVRNLVEAQSGSITVKSQPGAGATFTVTLPYEFSDAILPVAPARADGDAALPAGRRILVVEDNLMNQRIAALMLEEHGMDYSLAENGRQALERLKKESFDLILMDLQMPEMDGYSAARAIRKSLQLEMPIIAMTAHVLAGERERCLDNGMNDYISKPIREEALLALLRKYLSAMEGEPSMDGKTAEAEPAIDLDYLSSIAGGKPERIREMARIFLQQAPAELAALESAFREGDGEALARAAHKMRPTAAYMGFGESLGCLLEELESMARKDSEGEDGLSASVVRIRSMTQQAIRAVERRILADEKG